MRIADSSSRPSCVPSSSRRPRRRADTAPSKGEQTVRRSSWSSSDDTDPEARPSELLVAGYVGAETPWTPGTTPRAIVLGPSGEVLLAGDPVTDQKALLVALHDALNRYPALPLAEDLGPALREAQAEYFAGDWSAARKAAAQLAKRLAKKDPEAALAAQALADHVDAHERSLREAVSKVAGGGMQHAERLARLASAIRAGLPRSPAAQDAEAAADAQRKATGTSGPYRIAEAWVEALPDRPVRFPDVHDSKGKRFAKKLEAALRLAQFDGNLTQRMRELLARFEAAGR